ncbi:MAG: HpcH/HpaI aldolase/citrate lyase family protein [Mesorhizobium sp.]
MSKSFRPRRSVLYVPASSEKALAKAPTLACDVVVIDLEDAVAPAAKAEARAGLAGVFAGRRDGGPDLVIRVNALSSPWGVDDLAAAASLTPDAILLPKVDGPKDVLAADDMLDSLDADPAIKLWTMIETPKGVLNLGPIAELGRDPAARLDCLVAGTNDLVKETGVRMTPDRQWLLPWLMQIVLAARAGGIDALDGVSNDFRDLEAFARECDQGRAMGFDGKTLIHPAQVDPANRAFSPSEAEIAAAHAIADAFALPGNAGKGVIQIDGRMVERLHLDQALKLLART